MHETLLTQTDKRNIFKQDKIWECNWITEITMQHNNVTSWLCCSAWCGFAHILLKPLCSSQARTSSGRDFRVSVGAVGVSCGSGGGARDCDWADVQVNMTDIYVQVCPAAAAQAGACCLGRNRSGLFHSSPSTTA